MFVYYYIYFFWTITRDLYAIKPHFTGLVRWVIWIKEKKLLTSFRFLALLCSQAPLCILLRLWFQYWKSVPKSQSREKRRTNDLVLLNHSSQTTTTTTTRIRTDATVGEKEEINFNSAFSLNWRFICPPFCDSNLDFTHSPREWLKWRHNSICSITPRC